MAPSRAPRLLSPRARPGDGVASPGGGWRGAPRDLAAGRRAVIARQAPARWQRRLRRCARLAARGAALGLAAGALVGVPAAAVHLLRTARLLAVTRVEVTGVRRLAEAAVRAAAAVEPGTSLFALDPRAIRDRLEALPGVRRAQVVRHLPGRLVLAVEEREPYALVSPAGAAGPAPLLWVDAAGVRVRPEPRPGVPALPVLTGVEAPPAGADEPLPPRLADGLALLRVLERAGRRLRARVSEVDLARAGAPVLYTVDGITVRLGAEGWAEQLARLDGVLAELDDRGEPVGEVDLRFRDLVVLRPPGPAPAGPAGRTGRGPIRTEERR